MPALAALVLQGCDPDIDHTYLPPVVLPGPGTTPGPTIPGNEILNRVRQLIDLPAYPADTEVQTSMVLRNLPDMAVSELGPSTRAALWECDDTNCAIERDPEYHGTNYGHEFDGTFLAAVAIGGGDYAPPGSGGAGGGISWATIPVERPGETLGIAYGSQNTRLYSSNYNTEDRRLDVGRATSAEPTSDRLLNLWQQPWSSDSWNEEPLDALRHALTSDMDSEVHVIYFSPALFPLRALPNLTCVTATDIAPTLFECISAVFGRNAEPQYKPPNSGAVAYGAAFDWYDEIYDLMTDPANHLTMVNPTHDNAIFVVPAGDHGGEITDPLYLAHSNAGEPFPTRFPQADSYFGIGIPWSGFSSDYLSRLVAKLNEVFFADGVQAPTNIFAWVPAVFEAEFFPPPPANLVKVLPVVAVNPQGSIDDASSQCGLLLADYCVAAPGFYFSVTTGARPVAVGDTTYGSIALPNGDLLGSCSEPITLEQRTTAESGACYTSQAGPRLLLVWGASGLVRGSGSNVWDADTQTLTLASPVGVTEVAAAITTGALALINAHFKSAGTAMSAADLLARLRMTANKSGIYADTSIYGQGLIDVQAAITPQGGGGIALTELARGARAPLDASALVLHSPLFGDALHSAFAGQTFIALDELHAPFRYPLNRLLQSRQPVSHLDISAPLERSVQRLANGSLLHISRGADQSVSLAFQQGGLSMHLANDTHPGLSFGSVAEGSDLARTASLQADSALFAPWAAANRQWHGFGAEVEITASQRLSLSRYQALGRDNTELADDSPDAQDAIALAWRADFATARFGLQHVRSQSADELLGIEVSGGLGSIADGRIDAANTWGLIDLSARSRLLFSLWHLRARADNLTQGALSAVNGLEADSWALAFMLSGAANTDLTLRLEQPLRARSGTLHFNVPTGYTPDRRILFSALDADASPSGRELRVQADFSVRLGERGGRLQLSAGSAREPGHIRNAEDDHYALIGLSLPL